MGKSMTFGQKIGTGFAVTLFFTLLIAVLAIFALRTVVEGKDRVIAGNAHSLIDAAKMNTASEERVASARGYLLSKDESSLERKQAAGKEFLSLLGQIRSRATADESKRLLDQIERANEAYESVIEQAIVQRRADVATDSLVKFFNEQVTPKRRALAQAIDDYQASEERALEAARLASSETAAWSINLVVAIAVVVLIIAIVIAYVLTTSLSRQIGSAIQHVQSSSSELQAAANQQAAGTKEQATAMSEITTTISELLATSRQIAESAQRVAQIAEQTASSSRAGDLTVRQGQDSVNGIKRQVDLIVNHMLDLGKKSQQIGGILEIINELAEQTNILAINATIEAAGAGDAGRRFGVVADEIRKLADRVGSSTKEIRTLIEEIRSAVNTTVMATESGSKTVDAGMRQFSEIATSFTQINALVGTATEASREIVLSTKQQATAVEQVNVAVSNVAQATRETEASSGQTLQTASQLTQLSRELALLVQPAGA